MLLLSEFSYWQTLLEYYEEEYVPTITTGVDDHNDDDDEDDEDNSVVSRMKQRGLDLSAAQQSKFNEKKSLVLSEHFPKSMLYRSELGGSAANILNNDFAYLYVCMVS
jgi:hypothetical protein